MIYRFEHDGHGHVAAETRSNADIEPFPGLHYPASDIPQQARALYVKNWIRCIPDVHYAPVPIVPGDNPLTGKPLDLTFSALRSVSPVHLKYLSHMGVASSMSISVVVDGELWGLIACHHYSPRFLDCSLRHALELFAQLASLQLTTRLQLERSQKNAMRRKIQDDVLLDLQKYGIAVALERHAERLIDLVAAQSLIVRIGTETLCYGVGVQPDTLQALQKMLDGLITKNLAPKHIWMTDCLAATLADLDIPLPLDATVAGMLAAPISNTGHYLAWLLPELSTTVTWAGNPEHAIGIVDGHLTPRKSFAAWHEAVSGRSRPCAWHCVSLRSCRSMKPPRNATRCIDARN